MPPLTAFLGKEFELGGVAESDHHAVDGGQFAAGKDGFSFQLFPFFVPWKLAAIASVYSECKICFIIVSKI